MSSSVIAVYPGTFDPITLGHEDIVRRAARLFGSVVVGVAIAHHKKTMFTLDERIAMVQEALADCPNVKVASFQGLVRDFARAQGATVMVRGVRSMTDFDYEFQLAGMNRHLAPEVETVFLATPSFSRSEILHAIAEELGAKIVEEADVAVQRRAEAVVASAPDLFVSGGQRGRLRHGLTDGRRHRGAGPRAAQPAPGEMGAAGGVDHPPFGAEGVAAFCCARQRRGGARAGRQRQFAGRGLPVPRQHLRPGRQQRHLRRHQQRRGDQAERRGDAVGFRLRAVKRLPPVPRAGEKAYINQLDH